MFGERSEITHDVDIAALISANQIDQLDELFQWPYVLDTPTMKESLRQREDYVTHWATHFVVLDVLREAQLQVVA